MSEFMNTAEGGPELEPVGVRWLRLPIFRALRRRDFRLFWSGNFLSNVGTWMQNVAQGWLVLELARGQAAFWLGAAGFAAMAPMLIFTLPGGVLADRVNRRKLLLTTQSAMMVLAFILWGLTAAGRVSVWWICILSFGVGTALALNAPTYQAMVSTLVPGEELPNAIALNSIQFNLSRVIGPALGALAMSWLGVSGAFLLNALSFVAVLCALLLMHFPPSAPRAPQSSMVDNIAEGFAYVRRHAVMRALLMQIGLVSLCGFAYLNFIPLFARQILHQQERGYGLMMSSIGMGAVLGAATVASIRKMRRRGLVVSGAGALFYLFTVAFTFSRSFWLSCLLLALIGYSMIVMVPTINALLQSLSDERVRGRVMSMYALCFLGFAPIGSLAAGVAAARFGAPATIAVIAGSACVATLAVHFSSRSLQELD